MVLRRTNESTRLILDKLRRSFGEDISPMKRRGCIIVNSQNVDLPHTISHSGGVHQTIVRANEYVVLGVNNHRVTVSSHAWIHNTDKDATMREEPVALQ